MIPQSAYLFLLALMLGSCLLLPNSNPQPIGAKQKAMSLGNPLLSKVTIPTNWTQITLLEKEWTYSIPCPNESEIQTLTLTKVDNQEAIIRNWGTETQWYALKKVTQQGDSLLFETRLPDDSSALVVFSFQYLDKENNIVRWQADRTSGTFIPRQDTNQYRRIQQPCPCSSWSNHLIGGPHRVLQPK